MGVTQGVLAIDAGNSKTDVAVVTGDGQVRGIAKAGPFRPHVVGPEAALDGIADAVADALSQAGPTTALHTSACLANADLPSEVDALTAAVTARGWGESCEVVNDTFALLRAGIDTNTGIAVVCGAGINCVGVVPGRPIVRFAAVGHISGDWGGGGHLWREAMWWAARAEDGRGPDTQLREALPAHLDRATMAELISAIHLGEISEQRCMDLTPVLLDVAEAGDAVAGQIVGRQAREITTLAVAAARRLDMSDAPIDVVLGGGILTSGSPLLLHDVEQSLAEQLPRATPRLVRDPPIVGAALLGLDRVGSPPTVEQRVRESLAALVGAQRDPRRYVAG